MPTGLGSRPTFSLVDGWRGSARCSPSPPSSFQTVRAIFPHPLRRLSGPKISPAPLHHPCVKPPIGVSVHLVEFATGIPGAKVIAPTSEHWIEVCEDNSHILHSKPTSVG